LFFWVGFRKKWIHFKKRFSYKHMNTKDFREHAHQLVDWMADYLENIEDYRLVPDTKPRQVFEQIPDIAPLKGENFEQIFTDFRQIIVPNMTHWQNPSFFAYFPANSSPPSVLAEMLTATLAAQCMIWQTSPAAAELEEKMMIWLQNLCGLPKNWHGVIQDTASTATLCALLTAREQFSDFQINQKGFQNQQFVIYGSTQTHSSLDKAVKIAGFGIDNLRKIEVDQHFSMKPEILEKTILEDLENGKKPLCVVASIGTTSSTAVDDVVEIGEICQKYGVWLHIDAAYAGNAAILPEKRGFFKGLELADSYVFNPHKWLLTNFDCTAYFVKNKEALIRTFSIMPEYLKTQVDEQVNNYRDWGVQLGRRFRALKLWFVLRSYGSEGLQSILRGHHEFAENFAEKLRQHTDFEIVAPLNFNLVCFRFCPKNHSESELDQLNEQLLHRLNATGKVFLTHTKLNGKYIIRAVFGQTFLEQKHVEKLWELILENC